MKKDNLSLIGLVQAIGVTVYCALISGVFLIGEKFFKTPPKFLGSIFILSLLVFSAAITGSIVFGYPAYLGLKGRINDALTIFFFTLFYSLIIIAAIFLIILIF